MALAKTKTLQPHATLKHHRSICQDKNLTTSTREAITEAFAKAKTLPQAPAEPSPRHLPRQKPYHKHPQSLHHGICRRQKPYHKHPPLQLQDKNHKHPRSLHHGICQDKNFTTSTRRAFTSRHLPKQKPYHKYPRSLHQDICQDKNLTTSTRGGITTAFAKTKTSPQAPAEPSHLQHAPAGPSPRHLPRPKPYHKQARSLHHGICPDKNLTPSTRGAFTTVFAKTKTLPQAPVEPSPPHLPRQKPHHKHPRSLHHGICQDKNLTTSTRRALTAY